MSSGTFGYPLCFSAMLAAIGLMVSPRSDNGRASSNGAAPATRKECGSIATKAPLNMRITAELIERCDEFMRKYPDSEHSEEVATLAGELLVQRGDWKEVGAFYRGLEAKFPKSDSLDRFVFFQALAFFQDVNFTESIPLFRRCLQSFPNSPLVESASYYLAMSYFLGNNYKETLAACEEHLRKFPDGRFAGDMRFRISFIDFTDRDVDQSDKIIRELSTFLTEHPDDPANGSMLCLLADTYKKKKTKTDQEAQATEDKAIESYIKAVWTDSPDDVIQYALDSATNLLQARKDWAAIADLHATFLKKKPDSQLALISVKWVAKMKVRLGKADEAAEILANALKAKIANPTAEHVEFLIDELVKTLVPREKPKDIDHDAVDKQLVELLNKVINGRDNRTATARIYYARARLAEMLKRKDLSDIYLNGIATLNAKDPSDLSPALLAACGDILLKTGDLKGAEAMFRRLMNRFPDAICGDAGPVGLGYVALARRNPEEALKIFEQALKNPGNLRFKEATLGKLEALVELGRFDEAEKLAAEIINDKTFRGADSIKAHLLLARIYRKQAAKVQGANARDLLAKAHGTCIRVFVAYKGFPDLCAEAIWQASEIASEMGDEELRKKNIQDLLNEPKLEHTEPYRKAAEEKVLPPIPIPIVPTRFVIPDEIPDLPEPADDKPNSGNNPVLVSPATLNRIFKESEAAFEAKDYLKAAALTQQLLESLQSYPGGAPERIYFNSGVANLLAGRLPEAESAFKECIKRYPKGMDASRAYIGLGKSCMLQKTAEKKAEAIAALKLAAKDPELKDKAEMLIKEASASAPSVADPADKR